VILTGELDAETAQRLTSYTVTQIRGYTAVVTLDLSGLSYCDGSGVLALNEVRATCEKLGLRFALVRPQPTVRSLLDAAGLDYQ
jgi:anti-sigma B factor antagonist